MLHLDLELLRTDGLSSPITANAYWYAVELHMERLVWMALQ